MDYLRDLFNLYLSKENKDKKTILNIKKIEDNVEFSFKMKKDDEDKTTLVIPYNDYSKYVVEFINTYKKDLIIIDEKYDYDKSTSTCYYYVQFNTGRVVSFNGFTVLEINNVRNILYDININKEELRVEELTEEKEMAYKPRLRLQQAGFSSYATLFFVVIFFLGVLVISLLVFNGIFK